MMTLLAIINFILLIVVYRQQKQLALIIQSKVRGEKKVKGKTVDLDMSNLMEGEYRDGV